VRTFRILLEAIEQMTPAAEATEKEKPDAAKEISKVRIAVPVQCRALYTQIQVQPGMAARWRADPGGGGAPERLQ